MTLFDDSSEEQYLEIYRLRTENTKLMLDAAKAKSTASMHKRAWLDVLYFLRDEGHQELAANLIARYNSCLSAQK